MVNTMKHLPEAVPAKSKDPTKNRFFRFRESAVKCLFFLQFYIFLSCRTILSKKGSFFCFSA